MTRRLLIRLGALLLVFGIFGIGWIWQQDRRRVWEEPRWDQSRFVRLLVARPPTPRETVLWVVAVNPQCSHCRASLRHVAAMRMDHERRERHVALLVDTPRQPTPSALNRLEADEVWWDSHGTWRYRWGHRVYGEAIVFTPEGRYLRTWPPGFITNHELPPTSEPSVTLKVRHDHEDHQAR